MALIDLDKFVESLMWMWDSYKNNPLFKNPIFNDIKLALDKQGLVYKDGKIVKTQRRVSAEAKEDGYSESEDEKVRKSLIHLVHLYGGEFGMIDANISVEKAIVWLEKQTNTIPNECVFRPLAGTDIKSAAKQAIEQQGVLAKEIVLAFNGAYIPVKGKAQDIIVNEYNSWLKKQEQKPYSQMEKCIDCQFNYTGYCNGTCILKNNKQKPSDKIEPKFKVGDWIVSDCNNVAYIESISETKYNLQCKDGYHEKMSIEYIDRCWHLWTIQDAKDGDLIYVSTEEKGIQAIFHEYKNDTIFFHCYLCSDFAQGGYMPIGSVELVYPLQKTHYNSFFEKMHEAGYEWDANNKELNKIHIIDEGKAEMDHCFTKMMNGENVSSTWSEEDEEHLNSIISDIKTDMGAYPRSQEVIDIYNDDISFLKSLRDRVQPKQEWSEEDEYMLNETIYHLEELIRIDKAKHLGCDVQYYQRDIDWLKQRIRG